MAESRIRLQLSGAPGTGLIDARTDYPPVAWDAADLDIQFWLAGPCACGCEVEPFDISLIYTISLQLRASETSEDLLITEKTIAGGALTAATLDQWQRDEGYHGEFSLTAEEMDFAVTQRQVWLTIYAILTDGTRKLFGFGPLKIEHAGGGGITPATNQFRLIFYYTDNEGYLPITASTLITRIPYISAPSVTAAQINPGPYLRLVSGPDSTTGLYAFTAGGLAFSMTLYFPGAAVPLVAGSILTILSTTPVDGQVLCTVGGVPVAIDFV